jgi:hypothetical protein
MVVNDNFWVINDNFMVINDNFAVINDNLLFFKKISLVNWYVDILANFVRRF